YPDVSASETTGTAYVVGGAVIANRSVVIDPSSNGTRLLGDPVQWPTSTIAARGAIIYMNAGVQPLLGFVDFVTDRTSENGLFRIEWPNSGVLSLQTFSPTLSSPTPAGRFSAARGSAARGSAANPPSPTTGYRSRSTSGARPCSSSRASRC